MRGATIPTIRRMRDLRSVGLSHAAIAAVIRLDTGQCLSAESVRHYLRRAPKPAKRMHMGVSR